MQLWQRVLGCYFSSAELLDQAEQQQENGVEGINEPGGIHQERKHWKNPKQTPHDYICEAMAEIKSARTGCKEG